MRRREILLLLGGATIACPRAPVRAQQKAMPVIGVLHFASPDRFAYQIDALRQGLAENGYVDGKNVVVETRWAEGHLERLPELAADLVAAKAARTAVRAGSGCQSNRPSGEPKRKQRMGGGSSASGAHQGRRAADF